LVYEPQTASRSANRGPRRYRPSAAAESRQRPATSVSIRA